MIKVLLDQHISPRLVDWLSAEAIFAQYVGHLGRARMSDPALWRYAFEHDQVVVTANARHFLSLASRAEMHAGLIILRAGDLTAGEQWQYLKPVFQHVRARKLDLVNKVVEVWDVGRFDIRPLPPA